MKKKLLILSYHQFGYLVDTLKYCTYLNDLYDITYVGWDYNKEVLHVPGVKVKSVSRKGNLIRRNIRLLAAFNHEVRVEKWDIVLMHYTRGVSLIKLLNPDKAFVFDIRTLSVAVSSLKRNFYNSVLKFESRFFSNISVISNGIARQVNIKKFNLLPLGADSIVIQKNPNKERLHLLYVGTLFNRNIMACVEGMHDYIMRTNDTSTVMTIVGDSPGRELEQIRSYIAKNGALKDRIVCAGRVPHNQLEYYFSKASVGVAFIPMTSWYDYQPPTKTFEYLLSGLPVIATKTAENVGILKEEHNAVLIDDNASAFSEAIERMKHIIGYIEPESLIPKYQQYTWKAIVKERLIPILERASLSKN